MLGIGKTELVGVHESYYEIAFDLSDKGFGSFDRCLHILTVCQGERTVTEKYLSKLMLKEAKHR